MNPGLPEATDKCVVIVNCRIIISLECYFTVFFCFKYSQ